MPNDFYFSESTFSTFLTLLADGGVYSATWLERHLELSHIELSRVVDEISSLGADVRGYEGARYQLVGGFQPLEWEEISRHFALSDIKFELHFRLASTNTTAMSLDLSNFVGGVVVAECQSAGKGRVGRSWESPLGGIYMSVACDVNGIFSSSLPLPAICALLVATSLEKRGIPVGIKWPNDILIDGKKVGGILVEIKGHSGGKNRIVIGIGINTSNANQDIETRQISSYTIKPLPVGSIQGLQRSEFIGDLSKRLLAVMQRLAEGRQVEISKSWKKYDSMYGEVVEVHTTNRIVEGVCRGIDDLGRLILYNSQGEHRFINGEARLRPYR